MKKIIYASVVCSTLLLLSNHAMADEFKDLRQSSANMNKEQAQKTEAGRISPKVVVKVAKTIYEATKTKTLKKAPKVDLRKIPKNRQQ